MGWYHPSKFPNSSSRIHFNWFDRVCFKSLLFKFLFFNTSLNCRFILLLVIFSAIMQWGFCKYVLSCAVTPNPFQTWPFSTKWQNSIIFFCHSQISLICLIYLSLPDQYFYAIRSMTMFLKVLKKVNFRMLTQT